MAIREQGKDRRRLVGEISPAKTGENWRKLAKIGEKRRKMAKNGEKIYPS